MLTINVQIDEQGYAETAVIPAGRTLAEVAREDVERALRDTYKYTSPGWLTKVSVGW